MPGPFNHCHLHCQPAAVQQTEDEHALYETVICAFSLNVLVSVALCVLDWWVIDHVLYTLIRFPALCFLGPSGITLEGFSV